MIEYLLPLLESAGGSAGGMGGTAGLLNALLGGKSLGSMAGTPMAGGMQGATKGSGILGALSGGGMGALLGDALPGGKKKALYSPYLKNEEDATGAPQQYQFTQNRFRPINY